MVLCNRNPGLDRLRDTDMHLAAGGVLSAIYKIPTVLLLRGNRQSVNIVYSVIYSGSVNIG